MRIERGSFRAGVIVVLMCVYSSWNDSCDSSGSSSDPRAQHGQGGASGAGPTAGLGGNGGTGALSAGTSGTVAAGAGTGTGGAGGVSGTGTTGGTGGVHGAAGDGGRGGVVFDAGNDVMVDASPDAPDPMSVCEGASPPNIVAWVEGAPLPFVGAVSAVAYPGGWIALDAAHGVTYLRSSDGSTDASLGIPPLDDPPRSLAVETTNSPTRIIVSGGSMGDQFHWQASSQVALYDLENSLWALLPSLPAPRRSASLFVSGERLYVVGGAPTDQTFPQRSVYRYDLTQGFLGDWEELALIPEPRSEATPVWRDGKLVLLGGIISPWSSPVASPSTLLVFDPTTETWSKEPLPPGAAGGSTHWGGAILCGGLLVAMHAPEAAATTSLYWQDPSTRDWVALNDSGIHRDVFAFVSVDGIPWLLGGGDPADPASSAVSTTYGAQLGP